MKILLLSKYSRTGASSRLRSLQYLPYLTEHGFEVTVQNLFDDSYLQNLYRNGTRPMLATLRRYLTRLASLWSARRYDLVWIEYEVFPYLPGLVESVLRRLGIAYVADYDDAIFHNYDLSPSRLVRSTLSGKIDSVMRHAACVVAGNPYLAGRAQAAGAAKTVVIPTVVDYTRYAERDRAGSTPPVIGWIGSPSSQKYLLEVVPALARMRDAFGARVLLVGATPAVASQLPGIDVEVLPWSEDSEAELLRRMDIGIMPLKESPWELGKCGYKLIQYMACGIPVVASAVGVNPHIIVNSDCGLLARNTEEWQHSLQQLLASPERRRILGAAGREAVRTQYSLQIQAPVLTNLFSDIIDQKRT